MTAPTELARAARRELAVLAGCVALSADERFEDPCALRLIVILSPYS
jgi:hypothetical protein